MIILGVDPGIADTGYGLIIKENQNFKLLDYGTIKTKPDLNLSSRLFFLSQQLKDLINQHKPDKAAVEQLYFCKNTKTAMTVGQARGAIMLTLSAANLKVEEYTPLQIKQTISGFGRADKIQIQQMVKIILKLEELPKPDDAADALAAAICCGFHDKLNQYAST